jgi:hypothetical protein
MLVVIIPKLLPKHIIIPIVPKLWQILLQPNMQTIQNP